jgi:hypothetical protein
VRTLKKGRKQKGWSTKATCTGEGNGDGGCGAVLLVEQVDIYATHSSHYDGSTDHYNTFKCGECGVESDLPSSVHVPFTPPDKVRA